MKAIILAGGSGFRLYPSTKSISKQLLPIYDKPTLYYPLSVLMLGGIRKILIISTARDIPMIKDLFKDGSHLGLQITYEVQAEPKGIPEAFIIGEKFINNENCGLILGDNLFYGHDLPKFVEKASNKKQGATIFSYHVNDPERYGVVQFDKNNKAINIEEKPKNPQSNWAVTGLYFYDQNVVDYAKSLKPSGRNELEITDLNNIYLKKNQLHVETLGRGTAWLDTGTHEALVSASSFIQTLEQRQGLKIACLEEIAYAKKFIDLVQLENLVKNYPQCDYTKYLTQLIKSESGQPI